MINLGYMTMQIKKLLFLCLILFSSVATWAKQLPSYSIYNDTSAMLYFDTFDPGRGTWRNQSVNSRQMKTFTINSGYSSGKIRISTPTRGYNEYSVGSGGVYRLTWNDQKQMWDVTTDQSGAVNAPQQQRNLGYGTGVKQQSAALPYSLGDAVMVSWKSSWYPATVIQLGNHKVKIHYDGYQNNWDEWVGRERIRYR